jgi:uncharacterized protein (DUF2141 family)
MKKLVYFLLILILNTSFIASNEGELIIEVTGLDMSKKGNLRIGVFKKNGFPEASKVHLGKIIPVTSSYMKVTISKLEVGTYGIAVLQDQDKNGIMTTNFVGYPIEPYGFSNNKYGKFGPPDFSAVAFTLKSGQSLYLKINFE